MVAWLGSWPWRQRKILLLRSGWGDIGTDWHREIMGLSFIGQAYYEDIWPL